MTDEKKLEALHLELDIPIDELHDRMKRMTLMVSSMKAMAYLSEKDKNGTITDEEAEKAHSLGQSIRTVLENQELDSKDIFLVMLNLAWTENISEEFEEKVND